MPHTEESKAKIAAAVTERWRTRREELREKVKAGISKEEKARRSERMTGENNHQFGKQHTDEYKERHRELFSGDGNPFFGKQHTPESLERMRRAKLFTVPLLRKYGVTSEQYEIEINKGNHWCTGHKEFLPARLFSSGGKDQKPNKCRRCIRVRELRVNYGVTLEWYEAELVKQNGVCALCFQAPGKGKCLCVDHHHRTKVVRGLVCFRCNSALERLDDVPGWIDRATAYLLKYTN